MCNPTCRRSRVVQSLHSVEVLVYLHCPTWSPFAARTAEQLTCGSVVAEELSFRCCSNPSRPCVARGFLCGTWLSGHCRFWGESHGVYGKGCSGCTQTGCSHSGTDRTSKFPRPQRGRSMKGPGSLDFLGPISCCCLGTLHPNPTVYVNHPKHHVAGALLFEGVGWLVCGLKGGPIGRVRSGNHIYLTWAIS